jgi:hypothetical protein
LEVSWNGTAQSRYGMPKMIMRTQLCCVHESCIAYDIFGFFVPEIFEYFRKCHDWQFVIKNLCGFDDESDNDKNKTLTILCLNDCQVQF